MALEKALNLGKPLKQRGQGAVEAMLALPVFLILVCLIFQLFFLGIAQIQLQYAAFCAARIGVVNAGDKELMEHAIREILSTSPGLASFPETSIKMEILYPGKNHEGINNSISPPKDKTLEVQVHWNYPLIVPLADTFLNNNSLLTVPGRPSIHLRASWAMAMFGPIPRNEDHANHPQK